MKKSPLTLLAAVSAVVSATTAGFVTAQDTSQLPPIIDRPIGEPRPVRPVPKRVEGLRNMILLNDKSGVKAVTRIELGKYWIGLNCADVSPALRSQLKLKKGIGLLVVNAFEGSPSQKAGLKQHDIVVKADDKDIGAVGQLIDAVQKAGDSELKLEIIREGQRQTITVKSAERPKAQHGQAFYLPQAGGEHRLLFRTPEGAFTFVEPGIVLDTRLDRRQASTIGPPLPAGVSVTIIRKAGEPPSIHVEKDDKTWDITPDKINELPEELRPHVQAMLAPARPEHHPLHNAEKWAGWLRRRFTDDSVTRERQIIELPEFKPLGNVLPGEDDKQPQTENADPVESEIEKLKRELSEEMKQLRKAIEELQKTNEAAKN